MIRFKKKFFFTTISFNLVFLFMFQVVVLLSQDSRDPETDSTDFIEELGDEATINWTTKVLRIKGNGVGPESVKHFERKRILAKRAAKFYAYRNLVEAIKKLRVTSHTTVEDAMLKSDLFRSSIMAMVKEMRVVEVNYSNDGNCEITGEVDIDQNGQFLLNALNNGGINVTDNYPKSDWMTIQKEALEKQKEALENVKYALSSIRYKYEYAFSNAELNRMEERLKTANSSKNQLKDDLASAEKELLKTKNVVDKLTDNLINLESEIKTNDKDIEMTKKFLLKKKKELETLSSEIAMIAEPARERLLAYVERIIEIQWETGKIIEHLYITETDLPNKTVYPKENHTGLLVDARRLNLKPVQAPSILNQKKEKVYGIGVIHTEVKRGSMVSYIRGNIETAKSRMFKEIGHNPLIVKCIKVINESDIMISDEDVSQLVLIFDLLRQNRVAILL